MSWFEINPPAEVYEYPLPKPDDDRCYGNVCFDADGKPWFAWPLDAEMPAVEAFFIPVHKLLFPDPSKRSFLINNSGQQFGASSFEDKILVILILSLDPKEQNRTEHFIQVLREAYTEILIRHGLFFEVIFIGADYAPEEDGLDQEQFDSLFKLMPWLAIPWSDKYARQICIEALHDPERFGPVSCLIIQSNGYIMEDWPAVFSIYGAEGFPFTSGRLEELEKHNLRYFTRPPSMYELLGDSVISPQGDQVPTAHLENKIVGLFFPVDSNSTINNKLAEVWEELKHLHGDFEIVSVPKPYCGSEFPVSLPFCSLNDTSLCQKLWWIYHPPTGLGFIENKQYPGVLVIIGPQDNRFCSYYAADILNKYGAEGYPFTLKRAAELEKEKLEKLTLGSLLGTEYLVCAADGMEVSVSELSGKDVVVLVSRSSWHKERDEIYRLFVKILKEKISLRSISEEGIRIYGHVKKDEIRVLYISEEAVTDEDYRLKDPVILCPSGSAYLSCTDSGLGLEQPEFVVFGRDGRISVKSWWRDLERGGRSLNLSYISNVSRGLLMTLRKSYVSEGLVGWKLLNPDRQLTGVSYI